jgi:hypothetical protein
MDKLKEIIETADIDWSHLITWNVTNKRKLYARLDGKLTRKQLHELYNAMPVHINGGFFYGGNEWYDYMGNLITLSKKDVLKIDVVCDYFTSL